MTLPADAIAQIEAQVLLVERIERYRRAHGVATIADAIERLVRVGLFTEACPDGSRLVRRGERTEWRAPASDDDGEPVF